jgi:broad specificity phosphatase PhoE
MTRFYLVKTGRTMFEDQQRLDCLVGSPLTAQGLSEALAAAEQFAGIAVSSIYCGPGEAEAQTGRILSDMLRVRRTIRPELHGFDYGLWQGLALAEMKQRQPRLYRQWKHSPGSLCPPGGETLAEAALRLRNEFVWMTKHHAGDAAVLVVLRPMMLGLAKRLMEDVAPEADGPVETQCSCLEYEANGRFKE